MQVDRETSSFKREKKKHDVSQGCVLSSDFFSLFSEIIMRNLEGYQGIKVGGHSVNNLKYVDDTVNCRKWRNLQQLLDIVKEEK